MDHHKDGDAEISLKLLSNGRYTWNISLHFTIKDGEGAVNDLKRIDGYLKDTFPDHVVKSFGRISSLEE